MKGIIDSTLREGEQAARVYFDPAEKLRIIELLIAVGIDEIEVGVARNDAGLKTVFQAARSLEGCPDLALWCRCRPRDIKAAAALAPDIISLSIPVSDIQIEHKLRCNRKHVMDMVRTAIGYAGDQGDASVSLGLEDASRADMDFVEEVCLLAQEAGVRRIRFADTLGVMDPLAMADTMARLKAGLTIDLGVHTHNDFGMATANAVSALTAGADFADVTVHGLGERSGNAALEEVIAFMVKRREYRKYRLSALRPLSEYVARVSRVPVPPKKPVVGKDIFTCESGIHIDGLLKKPETYEPFDPSEVCLERKLLIGKKAGRNALSHKLRNLGIGGAEPILELLLAKVRDESARIKTDIPDDRLLSIYQSVCGGA